MIPRSLVVKKIERYPVTSRSDLSVVVLSDTFSQIGRTSRIEPTIFSALQNVDVIHCYFTGTLLRLLPAGFDPARRNLLRISNLLSVDKSLVLGAAHLSRFPNLQSFLLASISLLNDLNVLNGLNDLNCLQNFLSSPTILPTMRNSPCESIIGAYLSFSALSVMTPPFL
jgi:hypothetical protein